MHDVIYSSEDSLSETSELGRLISLNSANYLFIVTPH